MAKKETVDKIKTDLRISHTVLDDDVSDNIDACIVDLEICGIVNPSVTDPIILLAIKTWCRSAYTDDTGKAAAYMERYDNIKAMLMMASGYGGGATDG